MKIEIDFDDLQNCCRYNNNLNRCCNGKHFGGNCDVTECPLKTMSEKIDTSTKIPSKKLANSVFSL